MFRKVHAVRSSFVFFCKKKLPLARINHVISSSQSELFFYKNHGLQVKRVSLDMQFDLHLFLQKEKLLLAKINHVIYFSQSEFVVYTKNMELHVERVCGS